ncbi:MAG: recombinase family protein [Clostridia bacterium]|nr:recombinase family protein [Clostridia bacterium]
MKAAIYVRLSEEDRNKKDPCDDSRSISNQKELLKNYCLEQGWDVYDIYCDDDYAGADRNRPQFRRLIKDAEKGVFSIILCKTLSRFTREIELVEKYIHGLFPLWGIRFISVADNTDSDDRKSKKARQISGLINEWYLEDMSDSIKSVLTDKRKAGKHIGSFALFGYKKDPSAPGHLLPDPEAAKAVRLIFSLYSKGLTMSAIARELNRLGIPSPREYKRLKGEKYKNSKSEANLWRYPAVASILKNQMYIGHMVQGKFASESYKTKRNRPLPKSCWYIVENTHEPLIDISLWNRVQSLLSHSSRAESTGDLRQHSANG